MLNECKRTAFIDVTVVTSSKFLGLNEGDDNSSTESNTNNITLLS